MTGRKDASDNLAPEDLRKLLERFAVSYEVFPESAVMRDRAILQVGYDVSLYGDDERDRPLIPGDERSREVLRGLFRIARWAVPSEDGPACSIEVSGVGACLHYLNGKGRGGVQVDIRILHAGRPDRPLTADETLALEDLVARLEALGVRSGSSAPQAGTSGAGRA